MTQKTKSTLKRFVKGLIGAFTAQAILIIPTDYANIKAYLGALLVAGIAGLLMALEKNINWID